MSPPLFFKAQVSLFLDLPFSVIVLTARRWWHDGRRFPRGSSQWRTHRHYRSHSSNRLLLTLCRDCGRISYETRGFHVRKGSCIRDSMAEVPLYAVHRVWSDPCAVGLSPDRIRTRQCGLSYFP